MTTWAPPSAPAERPATNRRFSNGALFALALVVGTVVAAAIGAVAVAIAAKAADAECGSLDLLCGLDVLAALALGAVASFVGYIVAGLAVIQWCRPMGERVHHIAAHVGLPIVLLIVWQPVMTTML